MTELRTKTLRTKTQWLFIIAVSALVGMMHAPSPAFAQKPPDAFTQEVLIKSTLLTFNDANVTGNYTVLHAKLSKPFRDKFSPERLKEAFKVFHEKRIDFDLIAAKQPIASKPAQVNDNGVLMLHGHFDTTPSRLYYELDYIMSDGEWKPIRINVRLK
jgi:hypothetical protein